MTAQVKGKGYKWTGLGETQEFIDRATKVKGIRAKRNPFKRLPKGISK